MTEAPVLFLDTETYSDVPIKNGTHAYAERAEVMIVSYAIDDPLIGEGEVKVVDLANGDCLPDELVEALEDDSVTVVMHNGGNFDRVVMRHALGRDLPIERLHDTLVQALSHGLPGGLDKLCQIFDVPEALAKHKGGRNYIQMFCVPAPKNSTLRRKTKKTHPVEWQRFLNYAGGDIYAMRYLYRVMPKWNYPGKPQGNARFAPEHELWLLDQKINNRGFKVDTELARCAVAMVDRHKATLSKRTQDLTDDEVESTTQRDKLLAHLLEQYGVELPDMRKSTLERRLEDENLPAVVRELIAIRLEASGTSQAKYERVLSGVSSDGRLRGTLAFCGAARTGRWAGRLFQPQNMPRLNMPIPEIYSAIDDIKSGIGDLVLEDPMRAASNAIRGVIVAEEGRKLVGADLSNIEGRVLAWLAGEEWKLQAFRRYDEGTGPDLYLVTAGEILGKRPEDVTKEERQSTGKVPELACGFQGAAGAFATMMALYGLDLDEDTVVSIVQGWRDKNARIRAFWYALEEAAIEAILQPGVITSAGRIRFHKTGNWLRMQLPSGRFLCYANPVLVDNDFIAGRKSMAYLGINSYTRQWEQIKTYGGKIAENATQATARDVIGHNMPAIEEAGFPIILSTHDDVLTEPEDKPEYSVARLEKLLAATPSWADSSLPLAAEGFEGYRNLKE